MERGAQRREKVREQQVRERREGGRRVEVKMDCEWCG